MSRSILLQPIGYVRSTRSEPEDDDWDQVTAFIEVDPALGAESLLGLDAFSHVEVIFLFHRVAETSIVRSARHPRGRSDWPKVGIFAQRGKDRPNRIGATICKITGVDGHCLQVSGLDAIDGSPVLDIKPCMRGFLPRGEIKEPEWAAELMKDYWS